MMSSDEITLTDEYYKFPENKPKDRAKLILFSVFNELFDGEEWNMITDDKKEEALKTILDIIRKCFKEED